MITMNTFAITKTTLTFLCNRRNTSISIWRKLCPYGGKKYKQQWIRLSWMFRRFTPLSSAKYWRYWNFNQKTIIIIIKSWLHEWKSNDINHWKQMFRKFHSQSQIANLLRLNWCVCGSCLPVHRCMKCTFSNFLRNWCCHQSLVYRLLLNVIVRLSLQFPLISFQSMLSGQLVHWPMELFDLCINRPKTSYW